jgi:hypothetical protein
MILERPCLIRQPSKSSKRGGSPYFEAKPLRRELVSNSGMMISGLKISSAACCQVVATTKAAF